jgi:hypothetical protein
MNDLLASGNPQLRPDGPRGRSYIELDDLDDALEGRVASDARSHSTGRTIFYVVRDRGESAGTSPASTDVVRADFDRSGTSVTIRSAGEGRGLAARGLNTPGSWVVRSLIVEAGSVRHLTSPLPADSGQCAAVGRGAATLRSLAVDVAAVLVYDRVLTDVERGLVESYLQRGYSGPGCY